MSGLHFTLWGRNATYDARNRAVSMADTQEQAESKNRQTVYDAHGNMVGTTDAKGQSASSVFDARDRRVSETDRLAGVTSWRFDENSNLRHLADADNQATYAPTCWTYDARNLKLSEALPGHNSTSQIGDADYDLKQFTYDLAGRVDVATDQKGNNVTHLYDLASRLLQRDYRLFNQTAISDSDAFTYGDAGHMASAESGRYNNTVAFGYDAAGRLTSESLTVTFGQTTTYTVQSQYDAANRRTGITYPDGSVVARQYTARDQLAQIDYNSAMVATFAYDNGSRRTSRTLGDTPGTQTTWTYGRQDNLPTAISSDIAGASFTYTYDANKNKLTEGISAPMANYGFNSTTYDPTDRLTAWNRTDGNLDQAWDLSLVGDWATFTENQLQQTRSHSSVHEIAAIDASPIAHDATGNLTRNAGDTLDRYTWDFDNRLASADVDQDGTAECGYQYDALGRRVSKTVPDGEGSATTVFVYDGQQVVVEYAADTMPASPERKFVYAKYIDEPVMMLSTSGAATTPYYYHQNSLYSVAAMSDASGTVVERYAYSAYGKPIFLDAAATLLDPQASTIANPYLFTGRRLDEETGLYYYRARMYDSELGRFVGRDPIGYRGGINYYAYVVSTPLRYPDPLGLAPLEDIPGCSTKHWQYTDTKTLTIPTVFSGLSGSLSFRVKMECSTQMCETCCLDPPRPGRVLRGACEGSVDARVAVGASHKLGDLFGLLFSAEVYVNATAAFDIDFNAKAKEIVWCEGDPIRVPTTIRVCAKQAEAALTVEAGLRAQIVRLYTAGVALRGGATFGATLCGDIDLESGTVDFSLSEYNLKSSGLGYRVFVTGPLGNTIWGDVRCLVPQTAIVSPRGPRFDYFGGILPSFLSRLSGVWSLRRWWGVRYMSNGTVWQTCG